MASKLLKLVILVGSTREGRFGDKVGAWFAAQAANHSAFTIDLIDVAETVLPSVHPAKPTPPIENLVARLNEADAFVIVTPEYNHSYPGHLKHAIDQGNSEWHAKPVGFVSYGGTSGGLRAVEHLRHVFAELHAVSVRDVVSFHGVWNQFDELGKPKDASGTATAAKVLLDQLAWWAAPLRDARIRTPYGSKV